MVLIGQVDKLILLAKADRQDSAKQLIRLLSLDDEFKSADSHNKLRKNAFALLRLQRYKGGVHFLFSVNRNTYDCILIYY